MIKVGMKIVGKVDDGFFDLYGTGLVDSLGYDGCKDWYGLPFVRWYERNYGKVGK